MDREQQERKEVGKTTTTTATAVGPLGMATKTIKQKIQQQQQQESIQRLYEEQEYVLTYQAYLYKILTDEQKRSTMGGITYLKREHINAVEHKIAQNRSKLDAIRNAIHRRINDESSIRERGEV